MIEFIHWICWPNACCFKEIIGFVQDKIFVITNKSFIPWSEKVQDYLIKEDIAYIFLPQYCPELAPKELFFGQVKKWMGTRKTNKIVTQDNQNGWKILSEIIEFIDRMTIIKIWDHFISQLKQLESKIGTILNQDS